MDLSGEPAPQRAAECRADPGAGVMISELKSDSKIGFLLFLQF